jgi:hypothetical protein
MLNIKGAPTVCQVHGLTFALGLGTQTPWTAGLTQAYTGLGIYCPPIGVNNPQPGKKLVPLRIGFAPSGTAGTATSLCPIGLAKSYNGGTAITIGAPTGTLQQLDFAGTSTANIGTAFGTATLVNPYWVHIVGSIGTGAGTPAQSIFDFNGEISVMPGEAMAIACNQGVTAFASFTWIEVPLNSGENI